MTLPMLHVNMSINIIYNINIITDMGLESSKRMWITSPGSHRLPPSGKAILPARCSSLNSTRSTYAWTYYPGVCQIPNIFNIIKEAATQGHQLITPGGTMKGGGVHCSLQFWVIIFRAKKCRDIDD